MPGIQSNICLLNLRHTPPPLEELEEDVIPPDELEDEEEVTPPELEDEEVDGLLVHKN